jgi:hypothetical protein
VKPLGAAVALAVSCVAAPAGNAVAPVVLERHVVLRVEAMIGEPARSLTVGTPQESEIGPGAPAEFEFSVPWGTDGSTLTVRLSARLTSAEPDGEAVVSCESSVSASGGPPVSASRQIRLAEEGSGLFDVFSEGRRRIVLSLQGEAVDRPVVRRFATIGAPVRILVAVERVDGTRIVPLETDELHTFVGQSVEYSFRRGEDEGLEAVRLIVRPVAISGDLVTIEAEISGALPGPRGTVLVSHSERIVASRRATSRLEATAGTPPAGYRFQVTPEF